MKASVRPHRGLGLTRSIPLWASMMRRLIASPNPMACALGVKDASNIRSVC